MIDLVPPTVKIKKIKITGEKVVLRPMKKRGIRLIHKWANAPEVIPYWYGHNKTLKEIKDDWKAHYFSDKNPFSGRCFVISVDDSPVGMIVHNRIDRDNRSTDIDIVIGQRAFWNRGYGTDALKTFISYLFERFGLNRIWLATYVHNNRAIHVYEKIGFRREGLLRQDAFIQGRYVDSVLLSILHSEWLDPQLISNESRKDLLDSSRS